MDLPGEPTRPDDVPGEPRTDPATGDVLESGETTQPTSGSRNKRIALIAGAAVAVAAVGGGAYAAASRLGGGGTQPEDVLPSGAFAFAKMDLDPAANQKVAVYQLSKKFPALAEKSGDEDRALKDTIIASMFDELDSELDYEADVKPWLGDRAGAAGYAPTGEGEEPRLILAVEYTDEKKMNAALTKVDADANWTTRDGFVLIGEEGEDVEAIAEQAADNPLADDSGYTSDVDALDGDQVAVVWADIAESYDAAGGDEAAQASFASLGMGAEPSGRVAVGLRAGSDYLEMQAKTYGVTDEVFAKGTSPGSQTGTGLIKAMPADALAAVSLTGLGDGLTQGWDKLTEQLGGEQDITAAAEQIGLKLPADFAALLGDETALALSGDLSGEAPSPHLSVSAKGGDAARAEEVATSLSQGLLGSEGAVETAGDTVVYGDDPETVAAVASGADALGATEDFRKAAPDADGAGVVLYVNIARLVDQMGTDGEDVEDVKPLAGFGLTATGSENTTMRMRLTFR
jgi:hypothetical protein